MFVFLMRREKNLRSIDSVLTGPIIESHVFEFFCQSLLLWSQLGQLPLEPLGTAE